MVSYGEDEAYAVGRFEAFGHNSATELLRDRVGRDETKPPRAALAHGHSSFVPPMHHEAGALRTICGSEQRLDAERKSVVLGKSVSVRVDLGGRRIIKHKSTL